MADFAQYVGKRIELHYQTGEKCLPAAGLLVADSGRSIFLQEQFTQPVGGEFRWEIPYACIVSLWEKS
jgi:hypothetical protein